MRKIEIQPYTTLWVNLFNNEKIILEKALRDCVKEIHHIGSTSIPNLSAKPIIDMILEVDSLSKLDIYSDVLNELGYEAKGEFGISKRRFFQKGGDNRTHQIHAFKSKDPHIKRHLAFRDYLKKHHDICKEYEELKFKVAKNCNNSIELYCEGKDSFIKHHEVIALKWYETTKTNRYL